jgi:hypothetical protein
MSKNLLFQPIWCMFKCDRKIILIFLVYVKICIVRLGIHLPSVQFFAFHRDVYFICDIWVTCIPVASM